MLNHLRTHANRLHTAANTDALLVAALTRQTSGDHDGARRIYQEILASQPGHPAALHHLGLLEHATGRTALAIDFLKRAVAKAPSWTEAHSNLAALYRQSGDLNSALGSARRAIEIAPTFAPAHSNLGTIHEDLGELDAALAAYRRAASLDPALEDAHFNAATILVKLDRPDEALSICAKLLEKTPISAAILFRAGNLLRDLARPREAAEAYLQALALEPNLPDAQCNLGDTLFQLGAYEHAIAAFKKAIALDPRHTQAHFRLGAAYEYSGLANLAPAAYARALELDPDLTGARLQLHYLRRCACDWHNFAGDELAIAKALPGLLTPLAPFHLLSIDSTTQWHLKNARRWAARAGTQPKFSHPRPAPNQNIRRKLKIGYLSADFCNHATSLLTADLFECHDRTRFEIVAYSYGKNDGSALRQRIERAFDAFVDIFTLNEQEAAQRIFDDKIDILVDLKGYTQFARTRIAAQKPAPIQVQFLGYPGTMGADFIDYIIADPIVLPLQDHQNYSESIIHLPDCYQPNDRFRLVGQDHLTRRDHGLPETGFVFCALNNPYKITPTFFDIWTRLLRQVDDSVLWLLDAYPGVRDNLTREATIRGIDPMRLVFAPRLPSAGHIARLRLADLFLDTLPVNAHTTASEALWVDLPVLTLMGTAFAGRVAASLLSAIGLPELIAETLDDYESKALHLARNREHLSELRQRLNSHRQAYPLFDTPRFTVHLESAYSRMWQTWASGSNPHPFSVAPSAITR